VPQFSREPITAVLTLSRMVSLRVVFCEAHTTMTGALALRETRDLMAVNGFATCSAADMVSCSRAGTERMLEREMVMIVCCRRAMLYLR
jgi:hypothetical protein